MGALRYYGDELVGPELNRPRQAPRKKRRLRFSAALLDKMPEVGPVAQLVRAGDSSLNGAFTS